MESAHVFQQEQMYMDKMKGVSAVRVHFRYWGRSSSNERVPMGVSGISCDLRTKSSLGPNSYFTGGLIYNGKPNTRICATSATNAANCRTCQLDKSSVLVHCPIHCIASPPSEVPSGWVHQSQGFQNGNPLSHTPISIQ